MKISKFLLITIYLFFPALHCMEDTFTTLPFGVSSVKGHRPQMEDEHLAIVPFLEDEEDSALFAIFDGHGGIDIASYVKKNFAKIFGKTSGEPKERLEETISRIVKKLKNSILRDKAKRMGTCAIIVLKIQNKLYVANIGDSRAILCRSESAIALSQDHRPDSPEERARIEALGGEIKLYSNNIFRINGMAVSRAIGDFSKFPFIIATPEIKEFDITQDDEFLLLGCDGIFEESMSIQDAVDIVRNSLAQNSGLLDAESIAANALTLQALIKGSKDNLSAIVVNLKPCMSPKKERDVCQNLSSLISAFEGATSTLPNDNMNVTDAILIRDLLIESLTLSKESEQYVDHCDQFEQYYRMIKQKFQHIKICITTSSEKHIEFYVTDLQGNLTLEKFRDSILAALEDEFEMVLALVRLNNQIRILNLQDNIPNQEE